MRSDREVEEEGPSFEREWKLARGLQEDERRLQSVKVALRAYLRTHPEAWEQHVENIILGMTLFAEYWGLNPSTAGFLILGRRANCDSGEPDLWSNGSVFMGPSEPISIDPSSPILLQQSTVLARAIITPAANTSLIRPTLLVESGSLKTCRAWLRWLESPSLTSKILSTGPQERTPMSRLWIRKRLRGVG